MSLGDSAATFGQAPKWLLAMACEKKIRWDDVGVWVYISYRWGRKNRLVWVTRTKMAKELGFSRKTLYRHLARLEGAGAFRWENYEGNHGETRRMMILREVDPCVSPDPPLGHPRHTPCVRNGPEKKKTKKQKKEEECAATYVASHVPLAKDEEPDEEERERSIEERKKEAEDRERKRAVRKKEGLRAAAPADTGAAAIETRASEPDDGPPRATSRPRGRSAATGAPRPRRKLAEHPDVIAAFTTWNDEIKLRWPGGATRKLDKNTAGIIWKLLQQVDLDGLKAIIRLAVWDWLAIQDTIQPWYTKERKIPDFKAITYIFDQLVPMTGKGVSSHKHRVSEYERRFISKVKPVEPSADGMTMAERIRFGRGG
jgi:hypothetical protein